MIAAGRYRDEFERVDGQWRFSFRDYTLDLAGELGEHLRGGPWGSGPGQTSGRADR